MSQDNSNATAIAYTKGGATGVSFVDDSAYPDIDVNAEGMKGSGRLSVGPDGHAQHQSFGVQRTNVGQDFEEMRSKATGILDSARSASGGRAGVLNNQSVVMIGGMETSIGAALSLGYLRQDSQGNYVETSQGQGTQQQHQQQHQEQQPEFNHDDTGDYMDLHPDTVGEINRLVVDVPQHVYDGSIQKAIAMGLDSLDYRGLGEHMGVDPSEARARVEHISRLYAVHAAVAMKAVTPDGKDALAWSQENNKEAYTRAMRSFVMTGETRQLKELATKYVRSTDPEDASLRAAGFETRTDKDGTRMIRIGGTWTSVRSAVKQGII